MSPLTALIGGRAGGLTHEGGRTGYEQEEASRQGSKAEGKGTSEVVACSGADGVGCGMFVRSAGVASFAWQLEREEFFRSDYVASGSVDLGLRE